MDRYTATKIVRHASKTASKRVVQKTAEATEDLIGNKVAYKITSAGKTNKNTKELQKNERKEIYILPEKRR